MGDGKRVCGDRYTVADFDLAKLNVDKRLLKMKAYRRLITCRAIPCCVSIHFAICLYCTVGTNQN